MLNEYEKSFFIGVASRYYCTFCNYSGERKTVEEAHHE